MKIKWKGINLNFAAMWVDNRHSPSLMPNDAMAPKLKLLNVTSFQISIFHHPFHSLSSCLYFILYIVFNYFNLLFYNMTDVILFHVIGWVVIKQLTVSAILVSINCFYMCVMLNQFFCKGTWQIILKD